jgi:hypothetical protein
MSEFEPASENRDIIEKANKLRAMISMPGWRELFEPYLQQSIDNLKDRILHADYDEILELKVNQHILANQEDLLNYVYDKIKSADALLQDEAAKITTGNTKQ